MKISLKGQWEYRIPGQKPWKRMYIPCNWEKGGLKNYKGSVLFRKSFNIRRPGAYILRFNGIDYKARVWLNGIFLRMHTGYFQPFSFEIGRYLRIGKNILRVEVDSCPEKKKDWPENKKAIKGVFGHHDIRPGGWHPLHGQDHSTGGIWNTVEIYG